MMRCSLRKILLKARLLFFVASLLWLLVLANAVVSAETYPVSVDVPSASLLVSGYASPGSLVTIYDGGVPAATTVAGSDGSYTKTITVIDVGLHSISVSQKDIAGIESRAITRLVNIQHQNRTEIDVIIPPSIRLSSATVEQGNVIRVFGYAAPNYVVSLLLDNQIAVYRETNSDKTGYYEFTVDTALFSLGSHIVQSKYIALGIESEVSKTALYLVAPRVFSPIELMPSPNKTNSQLQAALIAPVITSPQNGVRTNEDSILVSGTAEPNSRVLIYSNGVIIGSVFARSDGHWSFNFYPTERESRLNAQICDETQCSEFSPEIMVIISTLADNGCAVYTSLKNYRFTVSEGELVVLNIELGGQFSRTLLVDWGDGATEKFSVTRDKEQLVAEHKYTGAGLYNGYIAQADAVSVCEQNKYFTVQVIKKEQETKNQTLLIILMVLPWGLILYLIYRRLHRN